MSKDGAITDSPQTARKARHWAVAIIVTSRVLVIAAGLWAAAAEDTGEPQVASGFPLVAWDSLHYRQIATEGYLKPDVDRGVSFFPAYPLLVRVLDPLVPGSVEWTMLIVANAGAIAGMIIFYLLVERLATPRIALFAVFFLCCYPPSMFLSAAYPSGLMLMATAWILLLAIKKKTAAASIVCGPATALRPNGVLLPLLVWLIQWLDRETRPVLSNPQSMLRWAALALVSVSGILAYQVFLWNKYDDFWIYLRSQDSWVQGQFEQGDKDQIGTTSAGEEVVFSRPNSFAASIPSPLNRLFSIGAWNKFWVLIFLGVTIAGLFAPGPVPRLWYLLPIGIFLVGMVPGQGARWMSAARFNLAAVPTFILIGYWSSTRPRITVAICIALFAFQIYTAYLFTRGVWAG